MSAFLRCDGIKNDPEAESCNLPESAKRTPKNGKSLSLAYMWEIWPHKEAGKSFFEISWHKRQARKHQTPDDEIFRPPVIQVRLEHIFL